MRHVLLTAEVARRVLACHSVQRDAACERVTTRSGFVEADVACSTDAEDLQINATDALDLMLIITAVRKHLVSWHRAAGNVDVRLRDVDVVKQLFGHELRVAFRVIRAQAVIFVQIEGDDVFEAQPFLFVQADQLTVKRHWRRSRGHAQHGRLSGLVFGFDELSDFLRQRARRRGGIRKNRSRHFLVSFGGGTDGHGGGVGKIEGSHRLIRRCHIQYSPSWSVLSVVLIRFQKTRQSGSCNPAFTITLKTCRAPNSGRIFP